MAEKETGSKLKFREKLLRALLFIASVAVIVYFLPREGKFRYHFQEGKPWKYGLLTASFDFPVYKSENQITSEQDSVLRQFQPYYKVDKEIYEANINQLRNDYNESLSKILPRHDLIYLEESLKTFYENGIITNNEIKDFQQNNYTAIRVLENNVTKNKPVSMLKTTKQVYEEIIKNAKNEDSQRRLRSSNFNKYIAENLVFDTIVSEKVRKDLLQKISLTSGLVQAGERIVDRGEIITPTTYNILRSLEIVNSKRAATARQKSATLIGQILYVLILMGSIYLFLYLFRNEMFVRLRDLEVIFLMITLMIMFAALFSEFRISSIYMVPLAIVPIVIRTLLDSRVAFFSYIITVLICSLMAPFAFEFCLLQIAAGITTIISIKELSERAQLVKTAIFVLLTYAVIYVCYTLISDGSWSKINPTMFIYFGISSAMLLFAYLLIYIIEKLFGFTSSVTLVELSNINSNLLRALSEECPGTFQHSLQVSNLCTQAARKINANVQLVRTAALYHDIGKINNPTFFTENQFDINPHDNLTYEESVSIIKQHVTDGITLAKKENLPKEITDFIGSHHGNGRIKYFYNKWCNENPDKEIDEEMFSYPGPNPTTREQALLMMADSVEAASRSLKDYSDKSVSKLVNNIIDAQVNEGMFKDTPLTFRDLEAIKEVFIERLKTMYHARISYPELKVKNNGKK